MRVDKTLKLITIELKQKYACQSSSDFYLNVNKVCCENNSKPDAEHVFNTDQENFYNDTESTKSEEPRSSYRLNKRRPRHDIQRFKHEVDVLQLEFLTLKKEKFNLRKTW
ncbi:Coiled-coil domain-containing protein 144A, partial [Plecturocebus cupreus]